MLAILAINLHCPHFSQLYFLALKHFISVVFLHSKHLKTTSIVVITLYILSLHFAVLCAEAELLLVSLQL